MFNSTFHNSVMFLMLPVMCFMLPFCDVSYISQIMVWRVKKIVYKPKIILMESADNTRRKT